MMLDQTNIDKKKKKKDEKSGDKTTEHKAIKSNEMRKR